MNVPPGQKYRLSHVVHVAVDALKYLPAAQVISAATHSSTTLVAPDAPYASQLVFPLSFESTYPVSQPKIAVGLFSTEFAIIHVPWPPVTVHVG